MQVQGIGFTKLWGHGSTNISQIIHKVWGDVEREKTGKAGCSQTAKGLAYKEMQLGAMLRSMSSPRKYISREATWEKLCFGKITSLAALDLVRPNQGN